MGKTSSGGAGRHASATLAGWSGRRVRLSAGPRPPPQYARTSRRHDRKIAMICSRVGGVRGAAVAGGAARGEGGAAAGAGGAAAAGAGGAAVAAGAVEATATST